MVKAFVTYQSFPHTLPFLWTPFTATCVQVHKDDLSPGTFYGLYQMEVTAMEMEKKPKAREKQGLRLVEAHGKASTLEVKTRIEGKAGGAAVSTTRKAAPPKGGR